MRYALRKKEKISEVFSEEYLQEHIIASLDNVFNIWERNPLVWVYEFELVK